MKMSRDEKIKKVMQEFVETEIDGETGDEFLERVKKMSTEVSKVGNRKREAVDVIGEIEKTHIYKTEVELKNLDLGKQGLLNNPNANLYHKGAGSKDLEDLDGEIFTTSNITNIDIEIDLKTAIIDGYRGRDYLEKDKIAEEIKDKMAKRYCSNINEDSKYEITDEKILISITDMNESIAIFNFEEYGALMDEYVNSMHEIMKDANINRADIKFVFDNNILILPELD